MYQRIEKKALVVILFLLMLCVRPSVTAQRNVRDSIIGTPWIGVQYGGNWTQGDLADRYGYLNHIGATAGYKTSKNWFWGLEGNFLFGNQVRMTGLFDHLVDSYGNIIDINGNIGMVYVFPRGFNVNLAVGKIIPVLSPNQNSGIWIHGGVGYLLHKLRVETQEQVIPQLELDYRKGYDRLSTGVNLHQFVGYAFMSNQGLVNFYAGFYASQGLTRNRRELFFDQPDVPVDQSLRMDAQIGFKVGWFIPIYRRQPKDFYFN